jgi:hypothetical protein
MVSPEVRVTSASLLERLAQHKKLCAAPRSEIEWIAAHGLLRQYSTGDTFVLIDRPVDGLHLVLT